MSLFSAFKTNKNIEKVGVTLKYDEGTSITIARAGGANDRYRKVLDVVMKPYQRQIQTDTLSRSVADALMAEVFAKSVVIGWEGVDFPESELGPAIENAVFTVDNCIRLFKELPDLFADIQQQANSSALFREVVNAESAKN